MKQAGTRQELDPDGAAPRGDDVDHRLRSIKQLLDVFKFERAVYLSVTLASLGMLLGSAGFLLVRKEGGPIEITGLFGSAGAITFTTGRLLRMWSDALRVLYPVVQRAKEEDLE